MRQFCYKRKPQHFSCQICVCVLSLFRIIKNNEALSEIMQDFKYDSEECDWRLIPRTSVPVLSHHESTWRWRVDSAVLQLPSWTPQLLFIDLPLAPPCSLLQSYSTHGASHNLALCVSVSRVCFTALVSRKKREKILLCCDEICKYDKKFEWAYPAAFVYLMNSIF